MSGQISSKTIVQTSARVISNDEIIQHHKVLTCHAPEIANLARPGHFVNVFASGTIDSILRKPFSIFKADTVTGEITLLYQVHGATTFGMAEKRPGDSLDIVGPLGGAIFRANQNQDVTHIMVGGGYGVPPLVFLAERIREIDMDAKLKFVVGARTAALLLCEAELEGLKIDSDMTTEDGSKGIKGRVTDALRSLVGQNTQVYCCGPTGMMRAVTELCAEYNTPCQVSLEVPMPCGVGICMGCVVDLADGSRVRACTDGPVFDSGQVLW